MAKALAEALSQSPGLELAGVDLSADSNLSEPPGRRGGRAREATGPSSTRRGGWRTIPRPSWGSTRAGSASSPT